jgi:hypothetical protein
MSLDGVTELGDVTTACLERMTDKRLNRFFLVLQSSKYLDRMVASLEQQDLHTKKLQAMLLDMDKKKEEMSGTIEKGAPELQRLITSTKAVQKQVEKALSTQYSGREVHIMGEINSLLAPPPPSFLLFVARSLAITTRRETGPGEQKGNEQAASSAGRGVPKRGAKCGQEENGARRSLRKTSPPKGRCVWRVGRRAATGCWVWGPNGGPGAEMDSELNKQR